MCLYQDFPTIHQSELHTIDLNFSSSHPKHKLVFFVHMIFSESEGELSLSAGDYILVWGSGEPQGGYFDAELLDGRRGLVPASYVQRLIGKISSFLY